MHSIQPATNMLSMMKTQLARSIKRVIKLTTFESSYWKIQY